MNCKLSILICTIPERKESFDRLFNELNRQCNNHNVQIIYDDAPKGSITIGSKRNNLLNKSIGEYVCFIDDDDFVSSDYIEGILNSMHGQDAIGFEIACYMDGVYQKACSSVKYEWKENVDGYRYVRSIYHKTPVKREIALQVMFPDKSFGEDYEYSMGVMKLIKSEIFIDKELYIYNYKSENPKTKYGLK